MTLPLPADALQIIREVLPEYVDVQPADIQPDTELAAIGADSLTLAELLFALEDRVGQPIGEPEQPPRLVRDLADLLQAHLPEVRRLGAA